MVIKIDGDLIRKLRKEARMTQAELAKKVGVTQAHISKIENGLVDPRLSTVNKIISVLEKRKKRTLCERIACKRLIWLKPTDTIRDAIELMKKHNISQIPVMKNDVCIGVITEKTIMNSMPIDPETKVEMVCEEPLPIVSNETSVDVVRFLFCLLYTSPSPRD